MLIHKLKLYPNQSQGGGYVYGSGGSGGSSGGATGPSDVLPNNYGYTPGGEYQDALGNDYVGAWHSHVDGTITKGNMHTNISNEDVLFPIVTPPPPPPPPNVPTNTGPSNIAPQTIQIPTPPSPSIPAGNNAAPISIDPLRSVPPSMPPPVAVYQAPPLVDTNIQQEYIEKGLTFKSNNKFINQRNAAGNLLFEENSQNNQNLIIEPTIETYTNKSFIEAVDTQFNYFKFPARIGVDSTLDLTFNMDFDIEDTGTDPITGFHILNPKDASGNDIVDYVTMTLSYPAPPDLELMPIDKTIDGAPIDKDLSAFVLTPSKIKYVKEGNKAIKLVAAYTGAPQNNVNTGFILALDRKMPVVYRDWPSNAGTLYQNRHPHTYKTSANFGGGSSQDHNKTYVSLQLTYIIDPNDMVEYDQYSLKTTAGGSAWYLRQSVKFDISIIDDPGPGGYGKQ
jgi:hypothetical protein